MRAVGLGLILVVAAQPERWGELTCRSNGICDCSAMRCEAAFRSACHVCAVLSFVLIRLTCFVFRSLLPSRPEAGRAIACKEWETAYAVERQYATVS